MISFSRGDPLPLPGVSAAGSGRHLFDRPCDVSVLCVLNLWLGRAPLHIHSRSRRLVPGDVLWAPPSTRGPTRLPLHTVLSRLKVTSLSRLSLLTVGPVLTVSLVFTDPPTPYFSVSCSHKIRLSRKFPLGPSRGSRTLRWFKNCLRHKPKKRQHPHVTRCRVNSEFPSLNEHGTGQTLWYSSVGTTRTPSTIPPRSVPTFVSDPGS